MPEEINFIFITHAHHDHIGGLIAADGKPVFPNAKIFISEKEADLNKNNNIFNAYAEKIKTFDTKKELIEGVRPVFAYGHTPGHTMYKLSTKTKPILFWGDILHAPVQFKQPEIYSHYDDNPEETVTERKNVLQMLSDGKTFIAGTHLIYPAIGTVSKAKKGYEFIPFSAK